MLKFYDSNIGRVEVQQLAVSRLMYNGAEVWSKKKPVGNYLNVSPEFIWLTSDEGSMAEFMVESNTDWSVELGDEGVDGEQFSLLLNSYSLSNNTLISNGEEAIVLVE